MNIKLQLPKVTDLRPRLAVVGVGGAGGNAVNNMIASGLTGVRFIVANTDAQSLANSSAEHRLQLGVSLTEGLGAGARPEIGQAAAEEAIDEIRSQLAGSHMVFIAAGMGGGTGTGAAPVVARVAREIGALTVGVVTKPFQFEGTRRMRAAERGIEMLRPNVDTLIVIPNQNLFRVANEKTTFADAFVMADQVLYSGVACIVDLIVKEGLINLDFADVRTVMSGMGTAMMGTGEAAGEHRAVRAAEEAIANPLLDDVSLRGAKGLLLSITGGHELTLYEVDEAATRIRQEVDPEANIIVGATFDDTLGDRIRVSIVASGMERLSDQGYGGERIQSGYGASQFPDPFQSSAQDYSPAFSRSNSTAPSAHSSHQGHYAADASPASEHYASQPGSANAARPGTSGETAAREDHARSLTQAIATARPDATRAESGQHLSGQPPQWTSAHGAVFEESPPQLSMAPAPGVQPHFERLSTDQEPSFAAQPPADMPRSSRRMPEVDDFPDIGKREYRAKSEAYANASGQPPATGPAVLTRPTPPAVEPPRKLGFFERLTGARRREQKQPPPVDHPQASRGPARERAPAASAPRGRPQPGATSQPAGSEEDAELPVFFGQDRKSR